MFSIANPLAPIFLAMNNKTWTQLVTALHASEHPTVLALTGGGSQAIGRLLEVPGSSRTVLEAIVPYATTALADWLGGEAEQSCSAPTARAMAMASWMHARKLSPDSNPRQLVGVGTTASLVSDRPKRGDHRVHVAVQTATTTATHSLVFDKGQRDRAGEEKLAALLLLLGLTKTCSLDTAEALHDFGTHLLPGDNLFFSEQPAEKEWTELLLGERQTIGYPESTTPHAIFPGAFNPLHEGHRRIARVAAERLGCPVALEISITNVDKRPLDFVEIEERVRGVRRAGGCETASESLDSQTLFLTDAPTFRTKATLFPGCTFVVGADTIGRIADPKYYSGEAGSFEAAIELIAEQGCRFLVFGREIEGRFRTLSDLELPPALRALCVEVSANEFREDMSSTELRSVARLSES